MKSFSNNVNIQSVHVFTSQLHIGNGFTKKNWMNMNGVIIMMMMIIPERMKRKKTN